MRATEILASCSVSLFFARMEDGTFRWVSDSIQTLNSGPHPDWVARGVTARNMHGEMNIQRPIGHDLLLKMCNSHLE